MKITALIENTACSGALAAEHGLSLYIEAAGKKVIFDTGESGTFAENAETLGVDLDSVDFAVLSHGHYDHGGGLRTFLSKNRLAMIHLRQSAFDRHYSQLPDTLRYNGLDETLLPNARFIFTDPICVIDEHFSLFSEVPAYEPRYVSNSVQMELLDGRLQPDRFVHEQNMVVEENGKYVLVAGCAHCGIYNIIRRFRELYRRDPDAVVGGFHLMIPSLKKPLPDSDIDALADKLKAMTATRFYTCHCTGQYAYERLRSSMGDQVDYLSGGRTVEI
jgi:7,8-dihydropterin-6-yl-methyl-4-(beta-D-ribofuranosyl)aminobenzene 5'-phosphate synthase